MSEKLTTEQTAKIYYLLRSLEILDGFRKTQNILKSRDAIETRLVGELETELNPPSGI